MMARHYFDGLHKALSEQYQPCNCSACKQVRLNLSKNSKTTQRFKELLRLAEKAFKRLHQNGSYKPTDLFEHSEYQALANGTAELFATAIPQETPQEMRTYLEQDVFVFSELKAHAQLTEARQYLKDREGNITPYSTFEQKVLKLNKAYNTTYLEAEYEFAVHSSQSAANWANLQDNSDRYWLEYRTAGDERVRQEHDALRGICLPKDDAFWSEYYPPNGWRCRCVAVEVLAREKEKSNSTEAIAKGRKATTKIGKNGKNKLAMFRFNPGQHKKVFPPNNSYSKVVGASAIIEMAKKEALKQTKRLQKERRKLKDKELYQWRKDNIPENTGIVVIGRQFKNNQITINRSSAKSVYSHFTELHLKELVKDIVKIVKKGQFKDEEDLDPNSHNYDKKISAGYQKYRYYITQYKGLNLRVNTAIIKGEEFLYSLNIIKKSP